MRQRRGPNVYPHVRRVRVVAYSLPIRRGASRPSDNNFDDHQICLRRNTYVHVHIFYASALHPPHFLSHNFKMEDVTHVPPTDIDPYKVLGIGETASLGEVKSAYRRLALQHHPGTHSGSLSYLAQSFAYLEAQIKLNRKLKTQLTPNSKRLHLLMQYSLMNADENVTTPLATSLSP